MWWFLFIYFFPDMPPRSLVVVVKTNRSYTHTHTDASAYSHTSLLTIKKPWPLGSFAAAQRNALSPRPFIRRNVRLGAEYVNTSGGGLYHLRVSPKIPHPIPCITPTTAHLHQSNTVFYYRRGKRVICWQDEKWINDKYLTSNSNVTQMCFYSLCMHICCVHK